jgi:Skp family chaperone for outer membrane proteins
MRDLLRVGGVLLILGALTLAGHSRSDSGAAAPRPRTRIAILNLSYVVKNYDKFKTFQEELKKTVEPYQAKDTAWKAEGKKLAKDMGLPATTAQRREEIEKRLKELQRLIEDNKAEVQKIVVKKQEEQDKVLHRDVQAAARRHARAKDLELVLHYNDAVTIEEFWSPRSIAPRMQAGALVPLYVAEGIDISKEIVAALNKDLRRAAAKEGEGG